MEAAVLVSAVFEDAVRKLAAKQQLDRDRKMELLIDDLVRAGTVTAVAGRRLKVVANLRNKADHAKWDTFEIDDVKEAVRTTRCSCDSKPGAVILMVTARCPLGEFSSMVCGTR